MLRRRRLTLVLLLMSCQSECENAPDFERMIQQARAEAFEPTPFFPDGRAMRVPPAGTVSRSQPLESRELSHGMSGTSYVDRIPLPVTAELLDRGQSRFDIHCAPCHGVLGDGSSVVARDMRLRKPPSFHAEPLRSYPPGRIYAVIQHGFGFMRPYANELDVRDRWATVAYVRALQRSQDVALDTLPAAMKEEARAWLK